MLPTSLADTSIAAKDMGVCGHVGLCATVQISITTAAVSFQSVPVYLRRYLSQSDAVWYTIGVPHRRPLGSFSVVGGFFFKKTLQDRSLYTDRFGSRTGTEDIWTARRCCFRGPGTWTTIRCPSAWFCQDTTPLTQASTQGHGVGILRFRTRGWRILHVSSMPPTTLPQWTNSLTIHCLYPTFSSLHPSCTSIQAWADAWKPHRSFEIGHFLRSQPSNATTLSIRIEPLANY